MHDSLWDGRSFRKLYVIDDYNRQVLWVETDTSLPLLWMIWLDNGQEFISCKLDNWCKYNNITHTFIQLSKPTQNAYVEWLMAASRRSCWMHTYLKQWRKKRPRGNTAIITTNSINHWLPHTNGITNSTKILYIWMSPKNSEAYSPLSFRSL